MFGNLAHSQLQQLWWIIASLVGALFLFLTFVQGGQTLLFSLPRKKEEKTLIVNSLGRKWELTFTTLVLFGGALFAAFPLFYATSFGGAYWVWVLILFTFILQAVSYEYRRKPGNLLGEKTYDTFLFINGSIGLLLIGAAVGTFFTGASFSLSSYNLVTWQHPWRGLEAALNLFNVALGVFLIFLARLLGAMYLLNNLDLRAQLYKDLETRLRRAAFNNLLCSLPFLLYILFKLVTMDGFALDPDTGRIMLEPGKYLHNLQAMPATLVFLLAGLVFVVWGAIASRFTASDRGIWFGGLGTVLVGMAIFCIAGLNNTPFYPSSFDPQSSLTIHNASSSHYTLTAMSYVALAVPLVLAYISYVWRQMDKEKLSPAELIGEQADELY